MPDTTHWLGTLASQPKWAWLGYDRRLDEEERLLNLTAGLTYEILFHAHLFEIPSSYTGRVSGEISTREAFAFEIGRGSDDKIGSERNSHMFFGGQSGVISLDADPHNNDLRVRGWLSYRTVGASDFGSTTAVAEVPRTTTEKLNQKWWRRFWRG